MIKVFIIHGLGGEPNGGWRPWLMGELAKQDIFACSLAMPNPEAPVASEWVSEIGHQLSLVNQTDSVILVGHSLGVSAILRYLEQEQVKAIAGAVLASGPCHIHSDPRIASFLNRPFNFKLIASKVEQVQIIHGDNDTIVPLADANTLSAELDAPLTIVPGGQHLNGSAGWTKLPQALEAIESIIDDQHLNS